ncbi:kelch-like protein 5 [Diadema setosum]|uniref:kelch-like protein 5 n=1 Tax=Diadema setosum TaxID=31175 RepID=UPI003B3B6112
MAQEVLYSCQGALSQKLKVYLKNSELSDISVKVGSRQYPAHRLVLGAASRTLAKMMKENPGKILQLKADDTEGEIEVFERMLCYMYTGEITFSGENIRMMISWADQLALQELSKTAQDWLFESLRGDSVVGVIKWLRETDEGCFNTLKDRCFQILAHYFEYTPETSWLGLSADEVLAIIERNDLVVADEETVIKRIDAWLLEHGHIEDIKELYWKMVKKIRLLWAAELVTLKKTSPLVQFVDRECPHLVSKAFEFRALSLELGDDEDMTAQEDCFPLRKEDAQPRLYLNAAPFGQDRYTCSTGGTQDKLFQTLPVESRKDAWSSVQMKYGLWTDSSLKMTAKMESQKSGDVEVWRVKYDFALPNNRNDDELLVGIGTAQKKYFRFAIVTTNHDADAEFYLPDNPVVTVYQGSLQDVLSLKEVSHGRFRESRHVITIRTPPIFAGRKPAKIKVMTCIYVSNEDDTQTLKCEDQFNTLD